MKKTLMNGIFALISTLWLLPMCAYVYLNPTEHWMNFRFLETAISCKLILPIALAFLLFVFSMVSLLIEGIKKD